MARDQHVYVPTESEVMLGRKAPLHFLKGRRMAAVYPLIILGRVKHSTGYFFRGQSNVVHSRFGLI